MARRQLLGGPGIHSGGSRCRVTFSLLPEFIVKRHRYRCVLIFDRLWDCLNGVSCRSREFMERHSIPYASPTDEPSELPKTCWSDLLDSVRTRPGYQLQALWVTRFSARAQAAVPRLMMACIAIGRDLRDMPGPSVISRQPPRRAGPWLWIGRATGAWRNFF